MPDAWDRAIVRAVYRYVSGQSLTGHQPAGGYLRRAAWRLGVPAAAVAEYAAYTHQPGLTLTGSTILAGVAAQRGARAARTSWATRKLRRVYTRPVLGALGPALGDAPVQLYIDPGLSALVRRLARPMSPAELAVRAWYGRRVEPVLRWTPERVMRGWWSVQGAASPVTRRLEAFRVPRQEDAGPRIELRASVPYLTPEQCRYVSSVIHAKVPAGELVESWDQVGRHVTGTWTVRRRPPAHVGYADLSARLDQLKEAEFFLGLGVGGRPVTISLDEDSPHIACSAGTGAGKSILAKLVAVQVLSRGGRVVILDRKGSHRWALGMPGVDYCTRPEQMHDALIRLAQLADDRNSAALYEDEGWTPGHRVLVIAEELNATFTQLRDYWAETRERSAPVVSPAVKAFRNLLFMGRSAWINVFAVAQMLTAQTTGGPESRENFGVRCLARYTRNAWQMLVPEAAMPRASRTRGRWQVVVGGEATECQVAYLSDAEARLLVHKGRAAVHVSAHTLDGPSTRNVHMDGPGVVDTEPVPPATLTLQDAITEGICQWSLVNTQKRLQRARRAGRSVPASVGKRGRADLYARTDLINWVESELIP